MLLLLLLLVLLALQLPKVRGDSELCNQRGVVATLATGTSPAGVAGSGSSSASKTAFKERVNPPANKKWKHTHKCAHARTHDTQNDEMVRHDMMQCGALWCECQSVR
jgi:hypothetical protein